MARELAAWRERTAAEEDRPVGSVLADPALVELAKRHPSNVGALEQIRGIHPSGIRRRGQAILDAVAAGMQAPPIPRDEPRGRSDPEDAPLIVLAEALLRARALEAGLAYELIASRGELELIVAAARRGEPEPEVRTLEGWRSELVGADLRDLLAGRKAVVGRADRRLGSASDRVGLLRGPDLEPHRHRRGAVEHRVRQRVGDRPGRLIVPRSISRRSPVAVAKVSRSLWPGELARSLQRGVAVGQRPAMLSQHVALVEGQHVRGARTGG